MARSQLGAGLDISTLKMFFIIFPGEKSCQNGDEEAERRPGSCADQVQLVESTAFQDKDDHQQETGRLGDLEGHSLGL